MMDFEKAFKKEQELAVKYMMACKKKDEIIKELKARVDELNEQIRSGDMDGKGKL